MIFLTLIISGVSFGMSSYVVPWANLKLYRILYDVQQLKPVFRLEPGHFNSGVSGYTIRITDKEVSREMLYGVRIYDHTHAPDDTIAVQIFNRGTISEFVMINDSACRNNRFVFADSGTVKIDPYGKYLHMMLYHGSTFETKMEYNRWRHKVERFIKVGFDSLYYSFDMSHYASKETSEDQFSDHQYMLNLSQLGHAIDSITTYKQTLIKQLEGTLAGHTRIDSTFMHIDTLRDAIAPDHMILHFPKGQRERIMLAATERVKSAASISLGAAPILAEEEIQIRERAIEYHGKMSLPLACIIFLFIGAPLGAIIRKGGIGMPIVVSVVLYLTFYVLMIQGKKMATEGVITPFFGAWLPVLVMLPLAIMLSLDSTASVRIFTSDNIWHFSRNALRLIIITNPLYWIYRIPPVTRFLHWAMTPIGKLLRRKETARTFRVRR